MFLFANFATAPLAETVAAGVTELTLAAGQGALFPAPGPGEKVSLVLRKPDGTPEIMHCTARVGDTLTVVRGAEGTTAQEWVVDPGEDPVLVSNRVTAEFLNGLSWSA